ncbi:hypothetical protein [Alysiella filiformis]|uniref:hypothetical protein n=1 Tax=Alysiella filiformis TaxID=194196 RepID=UPI0015CEEF12|nr:hypothetical protein [Alysiella filiformis]QMT31682.1 hypothetical protein H3L97_01920 [Alysiella filiformis]
MINLSNLTPSPCGRGLGRGLLFNKPSLQLSPMGRARWFGYLSQARVILTDLCAVFSA